MPWTSLCSIGGKLIRRTSPCTRIIGGRPADRCRSEALFLTAKASSSAMSIALPRSAGAPPGAAPHSCYLRKPRVPGQPCAGETAISAMNGDHALRQNYEQVLRRIREACEAAGRPAGSVRLLAVSKAFPAASILELAALGQRAFGENY